MIKRVRILVLAAGALLWGLPAFAQTWALGASLGTVNDVSHKFSFEEFRSRDLSVWGEFSLDERVQLRGTYGSLRTTGANSNRVVTDGTGVNFLAPELRSRVDYGTIGVSYEFWEGDYTSGLFGGLGGYRIKPDRAPAGFESFADPKETVLGFHVGIDGSLRVWRHLSVVGRLTVHAFKSGESRAILTADGGLTYRF
ncbi:MAG: hypothetical protein ABR610_12765 [Thermoanaerobaculia bacterium]